MENNSFKNQKILLVEDDLLALEVMKEFFENYFLNVYTAKDGLQAIETFNKNDIDVVICDIKIPYINGLDVIKKIREENYIVPIIITSAFSDKDMLLKASNLNIQGYIMKPIELNDIKDILNRIFLHQNEGNDKEDMIKLNDEFYLDRINHQLINNDEKIQLRKKESQLLELLLDKRGSVVTYEIIEQIIWYDNDEVMSSATLRTIVKNLRKKLQNNNMIQNISKIGYKIN